MEVPNCFYRVSTKGLILDDQKRFLLCRESDGRWDLPGGGLDVGEDTQVAIKREISEEMGLTVTNIQTKPAYFLTAEKKHKNFWIANVVHVIEVEDLQFTPSEECMEIRFCTVEDAKELNLFSNVENFLRIFDTMNH